MSKIINISDVHGTTYWKKILEAEQPTEQDVIVFTGDYFDSYDPHLTGDMQIANLKEILDYSDSRKGLTIKLIGNHDEHYLYPEGGSCSGWQMWSARNIETFLKKHAGHFQIAYAQDEYLFTHAGITQTFLSRFDIKDDKNLSYILNELYRTHPEFLDFIIAYDEDGYGSSKLQGCLWVRPDTLVEHGIRSYKQIVGHTYDKEHIRVRDHIDFQKPWYYFCDTHKEYLVIEDGKPIIKPMPI